MKFKLSVLAAATAVALITPALAADYVGGAIKSATTPLGEILTDANGMTLYLFDNDQPGVSNCYDTCAERWPPLLAGDGAMAEGDFSLVTRTDGTELRGATPPRQPAQPCRPPTKQRTTGAGESLTHYARDVIIATWDRATTRAGPAPPDDG